VTDKQALLTFERSGNLDQPTTKRLFRAGLIAVDDITTLDCEQAQFLKAISITQKGMGLLKKPPK